MTCTVNGHKFTLVLCPPGRFVWHDPQGQPTGLKRDTEQEAARAMMFHGQLLAQEYEDRLARTGSWDMLGSDVPTIIQQG